MTSDRPSRNTLATIRITEEVAWKVARWLALAVLAFAGQYAPRAWDYMQELQRLPKMREEIAALDASLHEQARSTEKIATLLDTRTELDGYLFERLASLEAADREPDHRRKATAAGEAVRTFREALARHPNDFKGALAEALAARQ